MLPKINAYTDVPSNFGFRVRLVIYSAELNLEVEAFFRFSTVK
jgi:hypothetical protein